MKKTELYFKKLVKEEYSKLLKEEKEFSFLNKLKPKTFITKKHCKNGIQIQKTNEPNNFLSIFWYDRKNPYNVSVTSGTIKNPNKALNSTWSFNEEFSENDILKQLKR